MRLRPLILLAPAAILLAACQPPEPTTTVSIGPDASTAVTTTGPGTVTVVPDPVAPVAVVPVTPVTVQPL